MLIQVQPDALLDHIVANVARYHATLPSITADESIKSDLLQHGVYRAHGSAQATIRVVAGEPGQPLQELRTFLSVNGKPAKPEKQGQVPFQLNGAFSRMLDGFFMPGRIPCYLFTISQVNPGDGLVRVNFKTRLDAPSSCDLRGVLIDGFARVDRVTAEVTHLERDVMYTPPDIKLVASKIEVDYTPALIGGQTYWLPTLLRAEYDRGDGHFEARYTNYHCYTGSAKILLGEPELFHPAQPDQPNKP